MTGKSAARISRTGVGPPGRNGRAGPRRTAHGRRRPCRRAGACGHVMHMCWKRRKVTRETNRRAVRRGQTRRIPAGPAPHAPARPTGHAFSRRPRSPRPRMRFHWFGAQAQRPQGVLGAHACRGEWFNRGCAQSYSAAGPDNRPVGRTRTAPEMRCSQRACNALGQERKHHSRAACQAITLGCRRWLRGRSPLRLVPAPGLVRPAEARQPERQPFELYQSQFQDGLWYSSTGSTGPSGRTLVQLNRLPIMM